MSKLNKSDAWIKERWARFPLELVTDNRLAFRHIKVLLALAVSRNEKTFQLNPSRETLSELSGIHLTHISRITRELHEFGWITKKGNGGYSMSNNYKLLNPTTPTRAESATPTRAESATPTRAESATSTRAESARGNEQQNKQKKEQYAHAILSALGVSKNIADDFIDLRKQKRAPITETAIEGIKREAIKAGFSFEDAIRTCCERGWKTFNAEWITSKNNGVNQQQKSKPWFMTSTGITNKGKEIGIECEDEEHFQDFKARVYLAAGITDEIVRVERSL